MIKLRQLLGQRSLQTLGILLLFGLLAPFIPGDGHRALYTFSVLLKDLLIWMMPLTVAFFIAQTVASFEHKAPLFIATIVLFETLSNFASVWYSYGAASLLTSGVERINSNDLPASLEPLWRLPWLRPRWWGADRGCLAGLLLGISGAWFGQQSSLAQFIARGKNLLEQVLTRVFARCIPLFILGFVANLYQTNLVAALLRDSRVLVLSLALVWLVYIGGLFVFSSGLNLSRWLAHIRHLLPAGGLALSSACSLSTMPWTIQGTAKNLRDPSLAAAVIPATTNIQQIGDAIANTFLCFALYSHYFGAPPAVGMWLNFSLAFVLARFATAAVLGGAIFVMLPIYETYLHFTPEMIAVILAYNVLLDPLITSSNVMANGALCRIFERVWDRVRSLGGPPKLLT